jgi:hypothetical protein
MQYSRKAQELLSILNLFAELPVLVNWVHLVYFISVPPEPVYILKRRSHDSKLVFPTRSSPACSFRLFLSRITQAIISSPNGFLPIQRCCSWWQCGCFAIGPALSVVSCQLLSRRRHIESATGLGFYTLCSLRDRGRDLDLILERRQSRDGGIGHNGLH